MKKQIAIVLVTALLALLVAYNAFAQQIFVPNVGTGSHEGHVVAADVAPYPDAPECATHDPTDLAHGVWNAALGCHYDHSHQVDPLSPEIMAIFGDYRDYTGQAVSYPWETWAGATPGLAQPPANPVRENHAKHGGYKFDFYDLSSYGTCPVPPSTQGIKAVPNAWLVERHSRGDAADAVVRIHSFWAMVRFCIVGSPGQAAYLYTGGWHDYGQRITPYKIHVLPYADTPSPAYPAQLPPYLAHPCINHADCRSDHNFTWVSFNQQIAPLGHQLMGIGFRGNDTYDVLDASSGFDTLLPFVTTCSDSTGSYVAEGCEYNNTQNHTFAFSGNLPKSLDLLDGVQDLRINYTGYTDRWGKIVQGCTAIGLDCVPVKFVNMPVGKYVLNIVQYDEERFNPPHAPGVVPEYDIYFDGQPSGWVGPNN
jgi:hypothetical protein